MELPLVFVAQATSGEICLPTAGAAQEQTGFDGVSIDSRTLETGQLFVPIVAENNGHDYIGAAFEAGAAGYLTAEEPLGLPIPAVRVNDTQAALADLARAARLTAVNLATLAPDISGTVAGTTSTTSLRADPTVVGITGSVGKTITKDFVAKVLSAELVCAASQKSYNNDLGVSLTILNAPDNCEVIVAEMGARAVGDISFLCGVARPSYGVLTSIGMVHMASFGSVENLVQAKGELLEALPEDGVAVLNCDDELVMSQQGRSSAGTILTFGVAAEADVKAEDISVDDLCRASYRLRSPWGNARVRLGVPGSHNVSNSLAASAVALSLGLKPETVSKELGQAEISPWRMDLRKAGKGFWVLNDSYNANPMSTAAALKALQELPAKRKVAVLGTMAELGDFHLEGHRKTAEFAATLGVELITIDEPAYGLPTEPNQEAVLERLTDLAAGDAVLVKASRAVGLEDLAQHLLEL